MEPSNTPSDSSPPASTSIWHKLRWLALHGLILLSAMFFLMVVMAGAAGWYTSRPVFCNSCHIMEPYYKSWQESSHKDVTCVECHFPPGVGGKVRGKMLGLVQLLKYVTASAGPRPSAEIPDASCLRSGCHETRLLSGRVDFHGIAFDHTPHMKEGHRGKTLRCTSCHSQIVQGSHMTVTTTTCFLCHFKDQPFNQQLSRCTRCHQIPQREFDLGGDVKFNHALAFEKRVDCASCHSDLIRGNGNVPRERCLSCHNREGDLAKIGDHEFMHNKHVTEHKVDCIQCHTPIEHNRDAHKIEHAVADCQACHPGHHHDQVHLLEGTGTKTLAGQANMMLAVRIECRTCHRTEADTPTGAVLRGAYEMCSMCHTAADVKQFETYHVALRGALPALRTALGKVEAAAKKEGAAKERAEKLAIEIADLRHDIELLSRGNEVHNMHYATKLVRQILERVTVLCRDWKVSVPNITLPLPLKPTPTSTRIAPAAETGAKP